MKVFIGWSGELSHSVAKDLSDWLRTLDGGLDPFVSSQDIPKGTLWFQEVAAHLNDACLGVLIVTPDNLASPWLYFEAGALYRGLSDKLVVPLLVGSSIDGLHDTPLSMFQATPSGKEHVYQLVQQLNSLQPTPRAENQLSRLFEKLWPDFEPSLQRAATQAQNTLSSQKGDEAVFARTQWDLNTTATGISDLVREASDLRMAGGTFKTFCDDARNLSALKRIGEGGGILRLLMLHPMGQGVGMLAKMRRDYAPRTTEQRLKDEIASSMDRLLDNLGDELVSRVVRFYDALPRYGLCISESRAVITLYLHGHGASSPSLYLNPQSESTKAFCEALIKGFDDSWSSRLSSTP